MPLDRRPPPWRRYSATELLRHRGRLLARAELDAAARAGDEPAARLWRRVAERLAELLGRPPTR